MKRTLICNADWVLTMNPDRTRHRGADILIEDNVIKAIGTNLGEGQVVDETITAKGRVVIPGFVNTHHHTFQSLVRNIHIANGLKLEPWLAVVYNVFREVDTAAARAGALVGLGALLQTGCTTSSDHFYTFPRGTSHLIDAEIAAAQELGIRFHPTRGGMTIGAEGGANHVPESLVENVEEILADSERLIQTYHSAERYAMCRVGLAPCWPPFETQTYLKKARELAEKYNVQCHTHLGESVGEIAISQERHGCRPVEYMRRLGWFGKNFYYAHTIQLNDEEVRLFAETKTGIAHCPNSNMFLSSGVCRLPDLMKAGAVIGLGVDGAASNNSTDMMSEIRSCYQMQQLTYGGRGPTAEDVLYLATAGGAKVLGRDDVGYLAPGMAADLVLMDWDQLQYAGGRNDPAACIVLSGDSRMVDRVLVNGRTVVMGGKLVTVDEGKTNCWCGEVSKEMLRRAATRDQSLGKDL